jgi:hypothetical protein
MKLDAQVVGNAGLYYVAYRLSLLGWNAMPTSRNARGIDVIAYSRDGTRYAGLQVKTLSKRSSVLLGKSVDGLMGDFWIIVNNVTAPEPRAFVMLPGEVQRLATQGGKDGRTHWLRVSAYDSDEFHEAWDRIGRGD